MAGPGSRWCIPSTRRTVADLAEQVSKRVAAGEPCWFPGLADDLVERFWASTMHLNQKSYRTATWLNEPAEGLGEQVPGQAAMVVEPLPRSLERRFTSPQFPEAAPTMARGIATALLRLGRSGPAASVSTLVRSIHCVEASEPGYDFSHSDPGIPFSVLLSNPIGERHAELRLAESLLHEAMHLQLTLIEREAPIVGPSPGSGYSPWQRRDRPIQGLLHGLYVFTAIHHWLRLMGGDPSLEFEDRVYIDRRLEEIAAEVSEVAGLGSEPALTSLGGTFAISLLGEFGGCSATSLTTSA